MQSCFATALPPRCRKDRVPPVSPRRLAILSIFTPTMMVMLLLLHVIGCSNIDERIGPDQKIQRSLDALKQEARRFEKQKDWASYAKAQNNLGIIYRLQAERGIEPEQNIQRLLDVLKEAARLDEEQMDWVNYAKVQNNLGMTYQALAQRGVEPEKNLRLAPQAFKEASAH